MLIIARGSAKRFYVHSNTLFLLEIKNQTVKDQFSIIVGMLKRWLSLDLDENFNALVEICNEACPEEALPENMAAC